MTEPVPARSFVVSLEEITIKIRIKIKRAAQTPWHWGEGERELIGLIELNEFGAH
jgi:hypothetical protein